jgi:hypothetical protein
LDYLKKHNGVIALHDNSDPDDIRRLLGMSKKTFKKAIGILYRQKLVKIEATQTVLV